MSDFYKLSAKLSTGEQFEFSTLRGSVILIVNTASQCGFTPQYVGLQNMYEKHQHKNFKILAYHTVRSQDAVNSDDAHTGLGIEYKF